MNFDLRIPLGVMFTIFGLILALTGFFGGDALTKPSLGINMNLWWGVILFLFGATMFLLAFLGRKKE